MIATGLAIAGAMSAIAAGFGDYVHYMNRDVNYWVYAVEGYIGVTITIGAGL